MPRKRPPFVELWRDRHGKVRVYFPKDRGARLPLPDAIGSDEFNAAYHAAEASCGPHQARSPRLLRHT
jgi:enterobacteria phage integrase